MNDEDKLVTLLATEYFRLRLDQEKLWLLEAGGVDNWQGYGDSLDDLDEVEQELRTEIFGT